MSDPSTIAIQIILAFIIAYLIHLFILPKKIDYRWFFWI